MVILVKNYHSQSQMKAFYDDLHQEFGLWNFDSTH